MSDEILTLEAIEKSFGGNRVIDGLGLSVRRGQIVGLLGPNGSGKSTLLNLLSGFLPTDAGRVRLLGTDVTGWPPERIMRLGLVRTFQLPAMPARMTVREVLQAGDSRDAGLRSILRPIAFESGLDAVLERFRLSHVADLPASALSGGQKKLLSVAMALRTEPAILCLDEPTAGVHPNLRADMVRLLRDYNARGGTLMIVEHDMLFIRELCSRCVVLDRGEVIADCPPAELASNPRVVEAYLGKAVEKGKVAL